nr:hypothetical protein [Candidatus Sigynarchaeota archaeon]
MENVINDAKKHICELASKWESWCPYMPPVNIPSAQSLSISPCILPRLLKEASCDIE